MNVHLPVAASEPGVIRSKAVTPPPQEDGTVRVVEIAGRDWQSWAVKTGVRTSVSAICFKTESERT
jgi:misacylated tRNA(Ala) deacylase